MQKIFAIPILSDDMHLDGMEAQFDAAEGSSQTTGEKIPTVMDYYETPISVEGLQLVAFSLVGLWAIFDSLPLLIREVDMDLMGMFMNFQDFFKYGFPNFLQLALGIWLFLRPWQFQGWIEKFKPKGEIAEEGENVN